MADTTGLVTWNYPAISSWPQTVRASLDCKCGKRAAYKRLVTETAPATNSDAVLVVAEREAVYCDDCGVVAWVR